MAADALKSGSITNLDSAPVVANQAGVASRERQYKVRDFNTPTATGLTTSGSTYKMVRLPSNCYIKNIKLTADAALDTNGAPTLTVNVGAYYSDSTTDGTPVALQGTVINATAFGSAVVFGRATSLAVIVTDGVLTEANRQFLLWKVLGLTADPGGNIDIVVAVQGVAATASANNFSAEVEYAMP